MYREWRRHRVSLMPKLGGGRLVAHRDNFTFLAFEMELERTRGMYMNI